MATFTWTYLPILTVLQNSGSINLKVLLEKLNAASQRHFHDMPEVERAITRYTGCLKIVEGDKVIFDRSAKTYAAFPMMERDISHLLHEHIPNMKDFELYEHKNPKNSPTCPVGVPWASVPKSEEAVRSGLDPYRNCDYRGEGEDSCRLGCGVKEDVLRRLGIL